MFGLVESDKGSLTLTALGKQVIDPKLEKAARAESFLLILLYKRVFDEYRNDTLPNNTALEKAIEKMGVAKQTDKARQALQRSAFKRVISHMAQIASSLPSPSLKLLEPLPKENLGTGSGSGTQDRAEMVEDRYPRLVSIRGIAGLLGKLPTEFKVAQKKKGAVARCCRHWSTRLTSSIPHLTKITGNSMWFSRLLLCKNPRLADRGVPEGGIYVRTVIKIRVQTRRVVIIICRGEETLAVIVIKQP